MSYIKLDRKMLDWGWYTDIPVMKLWTHILLKVNWSVSTFLDIEVPRGSMVTSTSRLAIETGLTEKQVRGALMKLEKTGEITTKKTNKYTQICVCKWDEYQGESEEKGTPEVTPEGNQRATSKEYKEYKNTRKKEYIYLGEYKNVKFTPEELDKLKQEFPFDYAERIERVSAYCASTGRSYKNYLATIRNWSRKERPKTDELDTLPTYDSSSNITLDEAETDAILALMGRN